jgi:hypothetical protein
VWPLGGSGGHAPPEECHLSSTIRYRFGLLCNRCQTSKRIFLGRFSRFVCSADKDARLIYFDLSTCRDAASGGNFSFPLLSGELHESLPPSGARTSRTLKTLPHPPEFVAMTTTLQRTFVNQNKPSPITPLESISTYLTNNRKIITGRGNNSRNSRKNTQINSHSKGKTPQVCFYSSSFWLACKKFKLCLSTIHRGAEKNCPLGSLEAVFFGAQAPLYTP